MEFEYNNNLSYQANFNSWFGMNTKERINNKEKPMTSIIAKREFAEMYGEKGLTEPKFGYDIKKLRRNK